jgi:hypothetical protein
MYSVSITKALVQRAVDKMVSMQKIDPCSVPAEFETLILQLADDLCLPDFPVIPRSKQT